jgi:phosphoribosylamine--glycine ligase
VAKAARPIVIKADGLAAGKGVTIARTDKEAFAALDEAMLARAFGEAGSRVIVEEFLEGEECSVLAVCRGTSYCILPSSQDHKAVFDHDEGPNTGGMGAYSPFPRFDAKMESLVRDTIIEPVLWAMEKRDASYTGILYVGLMLTDSGPKVLEINARSGDPETQAVLPIMDADFVELALAALRGDPGTMSAKARGASACVVMASGGYPGGYKKGLPIEGIEDAQSVKGVQVFHAGTALSGRNLVTNGGRVLGVTAWADDIDSAIKKAYDAASKIDFEGAHYRRDIGNRTGAKQVSS